MLVDVGSQVSTAADLSRIRISPVTAGSFSWFIIFCIRLVYRLGLLVGRQMCENRCLLATGDLVTTCSEQFSAFVSSFIVAEVTFYVIRWDF